MGFSNPAMPWSELERRMSGRPLPTAPDDGPGSRKRRRYQARPEVRAPERTTPYVELHCHSNFSFLDGASDPRHLVEEGVRLGLDGLALTDHDGFYGAPLFAEAAQRYRQQGGGLDTVYGAELSLDLTRPQLGVPDPEGRHLLVLAKGVEGYSRLAGALTDAHLRGDEKGRPVYDLDELTDRGRGHWLVLTGCRKGWRGAAEVAELVSRFGRDDVVVELTDHGHPDDSGRNDALVALAADQGLATVATGNVHYARPEGHRLSSAMAAVRARRSLSEMAGWLPPWGGACLRSGEEMAARFARYPHAVARSVELAAGLAFDLQKAKPELPKRHIPEGHTASSWLRVLTQRGFAERYAGTPLAERARERVARELEIIDRKDFAGYFVIVHDIVAFAREQQILCQGRGSAAASAVCYALGVTAIDPVFYQLPFARFISEHRDEEPDIDVDFDSDRREEVIQWVYDRYGRRNAAQVANIIGYRPKMAVRDAAKALGHSPGQQDAWSKQISSWTHVPTGEDGGEHDVPAPVVELANQLMGAPRHLGIHSGGMILTHQPIGEVCPIERARMDRRTVLQWDKDGAEFMGLVKFDLLGLGMLAALDHMITLAGDHLGERWTLAGIPKEEPAVYDMLCRADSVGVFQVESRAQIGTLPRLQPRCFYDLAIEIALIRPGPIQGGAVHPYIRRATGEEEVTYAHPDLEPVLARTLGVPLFQEQLMDMARTLGDCTEDEADLLRRAMGSKRGVERIESVKAQLYVGMSRRGITGAVADTIYTQILSFANFGFAESHSLSFAKLVYASSWFKLHYPAAFLAALLRSQPMGFYAPQSLLQDARRHGVEVRRPDLLRSAATADLEPVGGSVGDPVVEQLGEPCEPARRDHPTAPALITPGLEACLHDHDQGPTTYDPTAPDPCPTHRRDTGFAVRLGLDSVRGIGADVARRIVAAREERVFTDLVDLSRRAGLDSRQLEALATSGACEGLGLGRREALWQAGFTETDEQLPGVVVPAAAPSLPGLDPVEVTLADLWATQVSPDSHPVEHLRPMLTSHGIRSVADLARAEPGRRMHVAGLVTHRQRPGTASGITFLNLEDETGMLNVVCSPGLWRRHRVTARSAAAMVVRGVLERRDGVVNLVADELAPLDRIHPEAGRALRERHRSRDFR
ncbi:error-prone DNA polymerase [Nocardioides mangrovicus]|uniref:Error-prone DNA polymerase n=1 Tax=Nocardioides mangrovicus TaxID=2478913 RepID=A0A3L8P3C0_9ACTN|nr:error-prone DNA polymerase [Nocardioides mangrovicus]RLV49492.1 error-prone DNA polymerase [Nocardioides mangrovicus]